MVWATKFQSRVMSTAMAYWCWRCLLEKDRQTVNSKKDSAFVNMFRLQTALPERVINIADQKLLSKDGDEQEGISNSVKIRDARIACITSVLQIGISCSNDNPTDRLQISDALKELQTIRDKFGMSDQ